MGRATNHYLLRVRLKARKGIWRTISLSGDRTLHDLHEAIFVAFDRYDPHLYLFYFPRAPRRRGNDPVRIREFTAPEMGKDEGPYDDASRLNAAKVRLDDLRLRAGQTFEYLFDFGDSWWHEVTVEDIRQAVPGPKAFWGVVASRGASPPQYPEAADE